MDNSLRSSSPRGPVTHEGQTVPPCVLRLKRPASSMPNSPQLSTRRKSVDMDKSSPTTAPLPAGSLNRASDSRSGVTRAAPALRLPPLLLPLAKLDAEVPSTQFRYRERSDSGDTTSSTSSTSPPTTSYPSASVSTGLLATMVPESSVHPAPPSHQTSTLASRRALKNRKNLSLVVPNSTQPPPISTEGLPPAANYSETRSLPPSPVSLAAFIGVEGSELEDKTIGRLMMKQQTDELKEQMKGGRGMHRRTSIPRLNLSAAGARPTSISGGGGAGRTAGDSSKGSAVRMIRRDAVERIDESMDVDQPALEEFPYAFGPRQILPGVWLGSEQNARDPQILKKFGWVLNVAKEVECPWTDEVIAEETEEEEGEEETEAASLDASRLSNPSKLSTTEAPSALSPIPHRLKHRRNKTQAVISPPSTNPAALLVRAVASTPNLQSAFTNPSPPRPRTSHPPPLETVPVPPTPSPLPSAVPPSATISKKKAPTSVYFPGNNKSGRPSLHYLWLKWGHDEADLVESETDREEGVEGGKLKVAFDFIDAARASKNGNVLIHCQCGVSRSATVVIAYCMREAARALENSELKGVTSMHEAYSFVKERSEWVGPNLCLVFQLVAYERTLRGTPAHADEDSEPPYFNHNSGESEDATSAASSESHRSEDGPISPSFSIASKSTATTAAHSILAKKSTDTIAESESEECLSPMAEALNLSGSKAGPPRLAPLKIPPSSAPADLNSSSTTIFAVPRHLSNNLSPLPQNVTAPPPTPFQELMSPLPARSSFRSQMNASLMGVGVGSGASSFTSSMRSRFGYPRQPKVTLLESTPTASAFSLAGSPSAAQVSLTRGMASSSSLPNAYTEEELAKRKLAHKRAFSTTELLPVLLKRS